MIEIAAKVLKALNSDSDPWQIGFAVAFGVMIGLTPFWSPHNFMLLLLVCILRVHFPSFLVSAAFFSGVALLADSLSASIGEGLLTTDALKGVWTGLYQSDFWRFMRFNHTLTLGGFLLGLLLFFPVAILTRILVVKYRVYLLEKFRKFKVVQFVRASKFYELYSRIA